MKKNFHAFTVLVLIFAFTAAASASETRVDQLGSLWLVPDAYMDVVANPARINFLGKSIFSAGVDNFLFKQTEVGSGDATTWTIAPKAAYMGNFGGVGFGLIYKPAYSILSSDYSGGTYLLDNQITAIFGMKIGDKLSAGLDLNVTTHAYSYTTSRAGEGMVRVGVDYSLDSMDFGAVLSATNRFAGKDNGDFMLRLLGEIKTGSDTMIRFMNDTGGGFAKGSPQVSVAVDPFGGIYFGQFNIFDHASASYNGAYNSISYFISLHDESNIFAFDRSGSAAPGTISKTEISLRDNSLYLQAGFETKLFADWLTVRGSYTPLQYRYEWLYTRSRTGFIATDGFNETNTAALFDRGTLRLGFGINFSQDMILDVEFKYAGVVSYYHTLNRSSSSPDMWMETGYLPVNVEYTVRF